MISSLNICILFSEPFSFFFFLFSFLCFFLIELNFIFLFLQKIAEKSKALLPTGQRSSKQVSSCVSRGTIFLVFLGVLSTLKFNKTVLYPLPWELGS